MIGKAIKIAVLGVLCACLWLTLTSIAFMVMDDLFFTAHVAWWQRPLVWWLWLPAFGDQLLESLYLAAAPVIASTPFIGYVNWRFASRGRSIFGQEKPKLYGETAWATRDEAQRAGFTLKRKP